MKDTNLFLQYAAVSILLLGAVIWIIVKIIKINRNKDDGGCCGCSLSEVCADRKKKTEESCEKKDSPEK